MTDLPPVPAASRAEIAQDCSPRACRELSGPAVGFPHGGADRQPLVLVVDDDDLVRNLLVLLLGAAGYCVRAAADGEEALDLLDAGPPPDLVLLDVLMPGVDGGRLLGYLRAGPHRPVPVVVMTGGGQDAGWAEDRGAAGFLAKPFTEAALLAEVRRCLGLGGP